MQLIADDFQVDCRPVEQLVVTAVRYRPEAPGPADGLTLILAHGLGVHKVSLRPDVCVTDVSRFTARKRGHHY